MRRKPGFHPRDQLAVVALGGHELVQGRSHELSCPRSRTGRRPQCTSELKARSRSPPNPSVNFLTQRDGTLKLAARAIEISRGNERLSDTFVDSYELATILAIDG